jgi:5-methylcytosine-specific restriction endonuclease McrA
MFKQCSQCNEYKTQPEFKRDSRRLDGCAGVCKSCSRFAAAAWRSTNISRTRAYDVIRDATRIRFRTRNPERHRQHTKNWAINHPDKAKANWRNKSARKRGALGRHTVSDIKNLLALQKRKCVYCQASIKTKWHVDHIIPLVRGGTNWPYNLQLLCPACNMKKHAKDPIAFAQQVGFLI